MLNGFATSSFPTAARSPRVCSRTSASSPRPARTSLYQLPSHTTEGRGPARLEAGYNGQERNEQHALQLHSAISSCNGVHDGNPEQILYASEGRAVLSRLRDALLHDRRALRPGRYGHDFRAGDHAALPAASAGVLVHPGVAGVSRTNDGDAGGRRVLPLDSSGVRGFLGIHGGMVELVGILPAGRRIRRYVCRLFRLLRSEDDVVATLPALARNHRAAYLGQCARDPDGRPSRYCAGDCNLHSRHHDGCDGAGSLASQSVSSLGRSAAGKVQSFWRGACAGIVALLRI